MRKQSEVIDIYDFDRTVYNGDCSLDFYLYCLKRKPLLVMYLPTQIWHFALFIMGLESRTNFKSHFFVFLRGLVDTPTYVNQFWEMNFKKIKTWYVELDHSKDVIASASPEFLLFPVFLKLKAHTLIATKMNPRTGLIDGVNCHGEEKVTRLRSLLGYPVVRSVYSDSLTDQPLLALAQKKFLVKGDSISAL